MVDRMIELLEKLGKAPGPNFALEREIMWAIKNVPPHQQSPHDRPPNYTASIDAALELLPSPRWFWRIDSHDPAAWVYLNIQDAFKGEGATPAISLCIASLKARASR